MQGENGQTISGVTHAIQTEYTNPDGSVQLRKVKIDENMTEVCKKLLGQMVDIVAAGFAKGSGRSAYIDWKATSAPTPAK